MSLNRGESGGPTPTQRPDQPHRRQILRGFDLQRLPAVAQFVADPFDEHDVMNRKTPLPAEICSSWAAPASAGRKANTATSWETADAVQGSENSCYLDEALKRTKKSRPKAALQSGIQAGLTRGQAT